MDTTTLANTGITDRELTAFRLRIKGEIILPGDETYDAARELHNARIDKRPAIIVRTRDAADVSRAIHFARRHNLALAVRSGGHSIPGHSLNDGGLVIDMSGMDELRIDAEQRLAWAQPGVKAGTFVNHAQAHGLAVPFGDAGSVGVGGITLGGGIGFLARKYGLTIDHLVGVEMVTAEGQIVQASETENAELFWALRGGGGNFGVVTGFQFELVEVGNIYGGMLALPASPEVVREYTRLAEEAPEELTTISALLHAPPLPFVPEAAVGTVVLAIFACYAGDPAEGERVMAPFRALATPVIDMLMPLPYAGLYAIMDGLAQRARTSVRSGFYDELGDETVAKMLQVIEDSPAPGAMLQIRPLGGEMARVDPRATAFSHRQSRFMVAVINRWEEPESDAFNQAWVADAWAVIGAGHRGVYSNFLEDEGEARVREAYLEETYERLAEVKAVYDPENIFAGNQNVRPKRARAAA